MGVFSDHIGKVPGAFRHARDYVNQNRQDYRSTHQNMPGAKEYVNSDSGRAAARHSVGVGISRFLTNSTSKNFRRGNYVMGALMTFASHALSSHMQNLKHDQRIFENVARVRRGDPSIGHMTHNELREVRDHAQRYGGADHENVRNNAHGELERRHSSKGHEKATAQIAQDQKIHENRQEQREAAHANRMRRLREVSGHTSQARIADAQKIANIRKGVEAAKTRGVKSRQGAILKTAKEKARLIKKTEKGAYYAKEGGGQFYQADSTVAKGKAKGRKGSALPRKRTI